MLYEETKYQVSTLLGGISAGGVLLSSIERFDDSLLFCSVMKACMMMNTQSKAPTTIFVHQADSVPWKLMNVRMTPWIRTPTSAPGMKPTPPVSNVPPMTEDAMASISMPRPCRL